MQQSCPISCRHMLRSEPVAISRFPAPVPSEVQSSFSEIFGYLIASDRMLKLFVIPLLPLEPITLSLNSSIWLIWMPREKGLVPALHCPARPPTGFVRRRRRRYAELVGHKRRNLMGSTMETSARAAPARVSSSARLLARIGRAACCGRNCTSLGRQILDTTRA